MRDEIVRGFAFANAREKDSNAKEEADKMKTEMNILMRKVIGHTVV